MVQARNEKELGTALKDKADEIEITGDFEKKIVRIKATGKVAWAVAFGAIAVAVACVLTAPADVVAPPVAAVHALTAAPTFAAASTALGGTSVAVSAIAIAVAAGGVGALNSLRSYKLIKKNGKTILKRQ